MKLLIGIPAYNEGKIIGRLIKSIPDKINNFSQVDILVVDDGSKDDTPDKAGYRPVVVKHLLNRGLGGALKTIFEFARSYHYNYLITFDSDGQHNTCDIEKLADFIIKNNFDVVIGSRWKDKYHVPKSRYILNYMANIFTYILFGVKTSDSQSGLRIFNKKSIDSIQIQSDGMEVSSEIFREIYRHRLSYGEIPIQPVYTKYSMKKGQKISNAPDVFFQLLLRLLR